MRDRADGQPRDDDNDGSALARVAALLARCDDEAPPFPPTVLYNEGWLLRVVLDWFDRHGGDRYPMSVLPGARWFSEAWLPSAFLPRERGDPLSESRTHADGVIGHFAIGDPGTAGLALARDATQLVVLEAKLYSPLAAGVKNAPFYDQAARTVACMAEVLRRAERDACDLDVLEFLLLAPRVRIDDGAFTWTANVDSIRRKVRRRIEDYAGERDEWFLHWFEPTLRHLDVRCLSWEDVLDVIAFHDPVAGQSLDAFYGRCLKHNRPRELAAYPGRRARRAEGNR